MARSAAQLPRDDGTFGRDRGAGAHHAPGRGARRSRLPARRIAHRGAAQPSHLPTKPTCRSCAATRGSTKRGQPGLSPCLRQPAGQAEGAEPPALAREPRSHRLAAKAREGAQRRSGGGSVPTGMGDPHPSLRTYLQQHKEPEEAGAGPRGPPPAAAGHLGGRRPRLAGAAGQGGLLLLCPLAPRLCPSPLSARLQAVPGNGELRQHQAASGGADLPAERRILPPPAPFI